MTTPHETTGPRPVAFRGGDFTPRTYKIFGAAALIWPHRVLAARLQPWLGQPVFLRRRSVRVVNALGQMAASGVLAEHFGASLARLFGGFALGMTTGVGVG